LLDLNNLLSRCPVAADAQLTFILDDRPAFVLTSVNQSAVVAFPSALVAAKVIFSQCDVATLLPLLIKAQHVLAQAGWTVDIRVNQADWLTMGKGHTGSKQQWANQLLAKLSTLNAAR
jgi:hypothetical protein